MILQTSNLREAKYNGAADKLSPFIKVRTSR